MILSDYGRHVLLPEKEFADFQRPAPRSRARPAITPNGSAPARPANPPRPTSSTPAGSPKPTTSATSPSASANASNGTRITCAPQCPRGQPVHSQGVSQGVGAVRFQNDNSSPKFTPWAQKSGTKVVIRALTLRGWMHERNLGIETLSIQKDGIISLEAHKCSRTENF